MGSEVVLTGNATNATALSEATTTIANGATVRSTTDPAQIAATIETQGCGRSWYVAWVIPAATARDPPSKASSSGRRGVTRGMSRRYDDRPPPRLVPEDESEIVHVAVKTSIRADPDACARP